MKNINIPYMTFNRNMVWLDDESILGGAIIAYSGSSCLNLSGKDAASNWWLEPEDGRCELADADKTTVILNSSKEVILRLFIHEFLIEQNPELNFEIDSGNRLSSVAVVFERHFDYSQPLGAPLRTLFQSEPVSGKSKITIPIASILGSRGYKTRYMRVSLHLIIGEGEPGDIRFRAWSDTKPVLVPQLPQSYSIKRDKGIIPVNAVSVNRNGELIHKDRIKMIASFNNKDYEMKEIADSGIFQAGINPTAVGIYHLTITCRYEGKIYQSETNVSLTDGEFARHVIDEEGRHAGYSRSGKHLGFLSGSTILCDLIPAVGVGTEKEEMILDLSEFRKKTKSTAGKTDALLMTSLNEDEFNRWLTHRKASGYRMFVLSNWTPDILNAGGNISPYGAELAMRIFDFCRQNDIYVKMDLIHDTFARGYQTNSYQPLPNLTQYKEAGFLDDFDERVKEFIVKENGKEYFDAGRYHHYAFDKWCRPAVRKLTEKYFKHFLLLFRDETSIMLLSPCGEGDKELGTRIVNPLCDCIRNVDANHLLGVELRPASVKSPRRSNDSYYRGQDVILPSSEYINVSLPVKEHHYCKGGMAAFPGKYKSDMFISVNCRFFSLNPMGIYVEGDCFAPCWDTVYGPPYTAFHPAEEASRLQVRDFLWLALINPVFLANNWNELLRADEHFMPANISQLIDWNHFKRRIPPVMLRVYPLEEADIETLLSYEEAFSSLGLDYGYVWGKDPLPNSTDLYIQPDRQIPPYLLFDITDGFKKEFFEPANMPEQVKQAHYVQLRSNGYSAGSLISNDLSQIIIYLRNTTNYIRRGDEKAKYHWDKCVCRRGELKNSNFDLDLVNLPKNAKCLRLYDLNEKSLLKEERITNEWHYSENNTDHDFAVVITRPPG